MKIRVQLTQDDILNGKRKQASECPWTRAMNRVFGFGVDWNKGSDWWGPKRNATVSACYDTNGIYYHYFYIRNADGFGAIKLPQEIADWIAAYDKGKHREECELLWYDIPLTQKQWDMLNLGESCIQCAEFPRVEGEERCTDCLSMPVFLEPGSITIETKFVFDPKGEDLELISIL